MHTRISCDPALASAHHSRSCFQLLWPRRNSPVYRSGDPSPTGNVTVTLDQFGGLDATAFVCYSETQPNITLTVAVINDGERMSAPS
jgi:hypothetical protein